MPASSIELINYWIGEYLPLPWHPKFTVIKQLSDIPVSTSKQSVDLIVIASPEKNDKTQDTTNTDTGTGTEQDSLLQAIRKNANTALTLVLVHEVSPLSKHLANGLWTESPLDKISQYQEHKSFVQLNPSISTAYKLLNYLWLHGHTLAPLSTPQASYLYLYPLLSCWDISTTEAGQFLFTLERKHWLQKEEHINRTRHCVSCHSGHLNYIDTCPSCKGIDIDFQASLHCFNCGHVGTQDAFKNLDTLACPNCLITLRHIGVDYDRPIENQHCNSCNTLFIDANVQAQCLDCQESNSINDLIVNNIYSYKLSTYGKQLVRRGGSELIATMFTDELLPFLQFSQLVNWQNKLARRYEQIHQILSFEILNFEEVLHEIGDIKTFAQIDAIRNKIRSTLRDTDLYTAFTQHSALMFFPQTDSEGLAIVINKLHDIQQLQSGTKIEFSIKQLTLPNNDMPEDNRDWITDNLVPVNSESNN